MCWRECGDRKVRPTRLRQAYKLIQRQEAGLKSGPPEAAWTVVSQRRRKNRKATITKDRKAFVVTDLGARRPSASLRRNQIVGWTVCIVGALIEERHH